MHEAVEEIEKEKKLTGSSSERSLISTPKAGSRSNLKNVQSSPYLNALSLLEQKRLDYLKLIKDGKGRKDTGSLLTAPIKVQVDNNLVKSSPKVERKNIEKTKPKEVTPKEVSNLSVKLNPVSLFNENYNEEVENNNTPQFSSTVISSVTQPIKTSTPSANSRVQTGSSNSSSPKLSQVEKNSSDSDSSKLSKYSQQHSSSGKDGQNDSACFSTKSSKNSSSSEVSSLSLLLPTNKSTPEEKAKLIKDKENNKKDSTSGSENGNNNLDKNSHFSSVSSNTQTESKTQLYADMPKDAKNEEISLNRKINGQEMEEIEKSVFEFIKKNGVFSHSIRDTDKCNEFISSCVGTHLSFETQKELINILKKIKKSFNTNVGNNDDSGNSQNNIGFNYFCLIFSIF
jgi:hypothetical protein